MKDKISLLFLLLLFILIFPTSVLAMTLIFSDAPASVEEEEEFSVNISLTEAPSSRIYYLRGAFQKESGSYYFGYTFNHENNWQNDAGDHTKFLKITTDADGSWSGQLRAKADLTASGFKGAGNYQFKINRYTESGGDNWSEPVTMTINTAPTNTPTPEPTSTPIPAATNTPTPTCSPTPTLKLSPTPTTKISPTPTKEVTPTEEPTPTINEPSLVLGETATEAGAKKSPLPWPQLLIGAGALLMAGASYPFWLPKLKKLGYNKSDEAI